MKRPLRTALRLSLAALLASCGSTPRVPPEYPPMPESDQGIAEIAQPTREALRSEIPLLEQRTSAPIITLRIAFDAGSADDPAGRQGLTHLAAELMIEGGAGELTPAELRRRLYPMNGQLGVLVGRDQTVFVARVHRDRLDELYAIVRDVLLSPRMGQEDFERVRTQALSALTLDLRGSSDEELGKETLQAMLYEGHPYGHPELGTEAALGAITLDEVRAQRARVLCAGRARIGLSGAYPDGFAARVRADLAGLGEGTCEGRAILSAPADAGARIWIVDKPEASATAVSMGFTIDVERDDADYPAMLLAAAWLGQHRQFVGRLMQSIREQRGMNYGDYAYAEHFEQDGWGVFPLPNVTRRQQYFSVWLRPLRPEQAHFAIRLALDELRRFVAEPLPQAELDRIRDYLSGYYALFLQTDSRRLGFALDDAFHGMDRAWLERLREAWSALTPETLHAAVQRHLDLSRLQIGIVAPDATALRARIASEADSPMTYEGRTLSPELAAQDERVRHLVIGIPEERIRLVPLADVFAR